MDLLKSFAATCTLLSSLHVHDNALLLATHGAMKKQVWQNVPCVYGMLLHGLGTHYCMYSEYSVYKYRPPASPPLYILALDQQWATLIWVWPICVSYTVYIVPQHTQGVPRNVHTYARTHFMTL